MYAKTKSISPLSVRLARDFLLTESDWSQVGDCPLSADDKALYVTYRQKLRDITTTTEFTTNTPATKFPISPLVYNKFYKVDNPSNAYLATDDQFLPLAEHYLKRYQDRIAHYLLTKSWTERSFFDDFIKEYNNLKPAQLQDSDLQKMMTTEEKKEFLDKIIEIASNEKGS